MKSTIILCCAAIWLVLSGCRSTLEIGVDVYNGPLVNNQEIQMQQLISVVHGAYPLLQEMDRQIYSKESKQDADLESKRSIIWEILDMYKPRTRLDLLVSRLSQCMNNIDNASKDLGETSKTLAEFFSKPVADEPVMLQAEKHITAEMNEKLKQYNDTRGDFYSSSDRELCGNNDDSDDVKNNHRMVDLAYVKNKRKEIEDLNKWIANPSNDTLPKMPNSKNPEDEETYTTLKQWASYYAEFIFKEPWKRKIPYAYAYQKAVLDCYGEDQANTIRKTMSAVLERLLDANTRIYYWYNEYKEARQDIKEFVELVSIVVANLKPDKEDEKAKKEREEKENAVACNYGFKDFASVTEAKKIIAELPTAANLANNEKLKWEAANMKLKNTMEQVLSLSETTPLQHGRLPDGLWALMDKYIATEAPEHRVRGRRELLLELARFGEKLRMIGTYDSIVDTKKPIADDKKESIEKYRNLLSAIGNYVVFVADVLIKADAAKMRKVVEIYDAAKALSEVHKSANNGEKDKFLEEQVERLAPWVTKIRKGDDFPWDLLAMETVYEDAASLHREMVKRRKELIDAIAIGNDEKAGKFKKALEELIGQRSDVANLTSARDFLRTIVVKGDDDASKTIDAHIWQEVNKVKVSSMSDSTYVVVKDCMGNWNVRSMTADPKDMLAAAFGSGKAVAEILISGSTGGVSDAFREYLKKRVTEPETGAGSEIVKKQLEEAWHAYEHAVATRYESAFSEAKKDASEMLKGTKLDPSFNEDGKSSKEKLYELCNLLDKFKREAVSEDVKKKICDVVTATKEKLKKALADQNLFLRKYFEDLDAVGSGFETEAAREP
jgi:hypothetical protein